MNSLFECVLCCVWQKKTHTHCFTTASGMTARKYSLQNKLASEFCCQTQSVFVWSKVKQSVENVNSPKCWFGVWRTNCCCFVNGKIGFNVFVAGSCVVYSQQSNWNASNKSNWSKAYDCISKRNSTHATYILNNLKKWELGVFACWSFFCFIQQLQFTFVCIVIVWMTVPPCIFL